MKLIKQIEMAASENTDVSDLPPLEQLATYWLIIALILKFMKLVVGDRADAKIDEILAWGKENLSR